MKMPRPISFEDAKRMFVHRYTMEHAPAWPPSASGRRVALCTCLRCQPAPKPNLEKRQ